MIRNKNVGVHVNMKQMHDNFHVSSLLQTSMTIYNTKSSANIEETFEKGEFHSSCDYAAKCGTVAEFHQIRRIWASTFGLRMRLPKDAEPQPTPTRHHPIPPASNDGQLPG